MVVWVHGGSWVRGDRRTLPARFRPGELFDALVDAGLAVATVDYRLAPDAVFPAPLHDVKAAVRHLRSHGHELGVDADRIGIWGESAGAHLAALVGLTAHRPDLDGDAGAGGPSSSVSAVVDWYGPADLEAFAAEPWSPGAVPPEEAGEDPLESLLAGVDAVTRADASPVNHVTGDAPPFLVVHGTADELVPYAQSTALVGALTAAGVPVRLVPVEGAGHVFTGRADVGDLIELSVRFLADVLRAPAGEAGA